MLFSICGFSQSYISEGTYTTFDNRNIDVHIIEGEFCVLNIDTSIISEEQLADTTTLFELVERVDQLYNFYKNNLGYEPSGGNSAFSNKVNVFFGQPSCGAGCGLIGAKGVEVSFFSSMFNKFKYGLNNNPDRIIAYEFGRNFLTFSSKILFPGTPANGGFAEGFANIMYTYAYDDILKLPIERQLVEELRYIKYSEEIFYGYISDTIVNPYNSLAGIDATQYNTDPNRRLSGPAYNAFAILHGTVMTFGKEKLFPKVFEELRKQPNATSVEDALSNLAYAFSKTLNANLLGYFENVLKFKLNEETRVQISNLQTIESKLIKLENTLWFLSPFDKIRLNLRSTNYINDNLTYRISSSDTLIAISKTGNFNIDYSVLKGADEVELICELLNEEMIVYDSFKTTVKKRHNINVIDYPELLSNGYQYSNNSICELINDEILIENKTTNFDIAYVTFNILVPKNRLIEYGGEVRHIQRIGDIANSGSGFAANNGAYAAGTEIVGKDVGVSDSTNYYTVKTTMDVNKYFRAWVPVYEQIPINISMGGKGSPKGFFRNIFIRDITDTDGDGFIDFEDDCPSEFGTNNGCPEITNVKQLESKDLFVYPNPANHKLYIETSVGGNMTIHDLTGKLIQTKEIESTKNEIDISDLASGTYLLRFVTNERTETLKFIKK